jgi:hypothetical protein
MLPPLTEVPVAVLALLRNLTQMEQVRQGKEITAERHQAFKILQ